MASSSISQCMPCVHRTVSMLSQECASQCGQQGQAWPPPSCLSTQACLSFSAPCLVFLFHFHLFPSSLEILFVSSNLAKFSRSTYLEFLEWLLEISLKEIFAIPTQLSSHPWSPPNLGRRTIFQPLLLHSEGSLHGERPAVVILRLPAV